jgi:hypothetical protein
MSDNHHQVALMAATEWARANAVSCPVDRFGNAFSGVYWDCLNGMRERDVPIKKTATIPEDTARAVLRLIAGIAVEHGGALKAPQTLFPLSAQKNAGSEFSRGVLACVFHVFHALSQTAQGRHAILDLGYQPLFEDVKSPRGGGLDD